MRGVYVGLAILGMMVAAFFSGYQYSRASSAEAAAEQIAAAHTRAMKTEGAIRDAYSQASTAWSQALAENRSRVADLSRLLRERPERLPEPARAACSGSSGAELSRPDAEFLVREAARANEYAIALNACQQRERSVYEALKVKP